MGAIRDLWDAGKPWRPAAAEKWGEALSDAVDAAVTPELLGNFVPVSVKDPQFGATGDGSTDDTAAIVAARDFAIEEGRPLFFPGGTYRVNVAAGESLLTIREGHLRHVVGDGSGVSVVWNADGAGRVMTVGGYLEGVDTSLCSVRGITLRGNASSDVGIWGRNKSKVNLFDVEVRGHGSHGVDIRNCNTWRAWGCRFWQNSGWGIYGRYFTSRDPEDPWEETADGSSANHANQWEGVLLEHNTLGGAYLTSFISLKMSGVVQFNSGPALRINDGNAVELWYHQENNNGIALEMGVGEDDEIGSEGGCRGVKVLTSGKCVLYRCAEMELNVSGSNNEAAEGLVDLHGLYTGSMVVRNTGTGPDVLRYDDVLLSNTAPDRLVFGQGLLFHSRNATGHNNANRAAFTIDGGARPRALELTGTGYLQLSRVGAAVPPPTASVDYRAAMRLVGGSGSTPDRIDVCFRVGTAGYEWVDLLQWAGMQRTNTQSGSYTLAIGDIGKTVETNSASANTVTVPPNSEVEFPVGTVIEVFQLGTGATTIAEGSGVTVRTPETLELAGQYSTARLRKRATNEWVLSGDMAESV